MIQSRIRRAIQRNRNDFAIVHHICSPHAVEKLSIKPYGMARKQRNPATTRNVRSAVLSAQHNLMGELKMGSRAEIVGVSVMMGKYASSAEYTTMKSHR